MPKSKDEDGRDDDSEEIEDSEEIDSGEGEEDDEEEMDLFEVLEDMQAQIESNTEIIGKMATAFVHTLGNLLVLTDSMATAEQRAKARHQVNQFIQAFTRQPKGGNK